MYTSVSMCASILLAIMNLTFFLNYVELKKLKENFEKKLSCGIQHVCQCHKLQLWSILYKPLCCGKR